MKRMKKLAAIGIAVALMCVAGLCGCDRGETAGGNENTSGGNQQESKCEHSYSARVVEATCTAKGYTVYTCGLCGDSYKGNEVDALGHNYTEKEVAATCLQKGYTLHSCTRCSDNYRDNETKLGDHMGVGTCSVCRANVFTLFTEHCMKKGTINEKGEYWINLNNVFTSGDTRDDFAMCYNPQEGNVTWLTLSTNTARGEVSAIMISFDQVNGSYQYTFLTSVITGTLDQGLSGIIPAASLKDLSALPYSGCSLTGTYLQSLIPNLCKLACTLAQLTVTFADLYFATSDAQLTSANFGFSV